MGRSGSTLVLGGAIVLAAVLARLRSAIRQREHKRQTLLNLARVHLMLDEELLKRHTKFVSVTNSMTGKTHKLRTVFIPAPVPSTATVVFVHGMGSSLEIWSRQIAYLRQLCEHDGRRYAVNMLLLDWIGHGQSECPDEPDAYNHDAVVDTVVQVIDDARREHAFEELHFVSHSYGTAIVTRLIPILYERIQFNTQKSTPTPASPQPSSDMHFGNDDHDDERAPLIAASSSPSPSALKFSYEIKSCIFLGAAPLDNKRSISRQHRFIISAPAPIFSLFRQFDRFGGRNSASVKRYLHANAVIELKQQQLEWNRSVQTWVFQRVFRGVQFASRQEMQRLGEIGVEIGTKLAVAAGDKDQVSRPPIEIARTIASILQIQPREKNGENYIVMNGAGHQLMIERPDLTNELLLRTIFH